jgi:hypothetical protein
VVAEKAQAGAATSSRSNVDIATVTAAPASTEERLLLRPRTASIVACGYRRTGGMWADDDDDTIVRYRYDADDTSTCTDVLVHPSTVASRVVTSVL